MTQPRAVAALLPMCVPGARSSPRTSGAGPRTSSSATDLVDSVARLFELFLVRFGQRWQRSYEDPGARRAWLRDLAKSGVSARQVARGAELCRELEWPPSVGEFLRYCRPTPEMLGLPSPEHAYREACVNVARIAAGAPVAWSHAAVLCAAGSVPCWRDSVSGAWMPDGATRPVFERAYHVAVHQLLEGAPLQPPPLALPARAGRADRALARRALRALRETLHGAR